MLFTNVLNFSSLVMDYNLVYDLAKMSHNVYYKLGDKMWLNTTLDNVYDLSISNETVRSYLFTNIVKDKAVIAFKGTSVYWVSETTNSENSEKYNINNDVLFSNMCDLSSSGNDKYNDNLFFSCCFYKQSSLFTKCECQGSEWKHGYKIGKSECCINCYDNSLEYEMNYIRMIEQVVDKSRDIIDFDKVDVYFTGHSLGGMLASTASALYNKVAATFETPGDKHYLDLTNIVHKHNQVFHFGHNGDPIFTGNCGRTCSVVGYNIDTRCHTGYTCLYDSKSKLGYTESILNHRIEYIIKNVIPKWEIDPPECNINTDCIECEFWEYV